MRDILVIVVVEWKDRMRQKEIEHVSVSCQLIEPYELIMCDSGCDGGILDVLWYEGIVNVCDLACF